MLRSVSYFVDKRGYVPVKEFINTFSPKEKAKIFAYIEELKEQGYSLHRPMAAYLGEGIYELRPKNNRIFYFFYLRDNIVLLHAIRKKTDRIPEGDLTICLKRRNEVELLHNIEKFDL